MLALFCLITIGAAIVLGRLFYNGSREARAAPAPMATTPEAPARRSRRRAAAAAQATPPPADRRPTGLCPRCGSETVPGAKFCGECGNRLAA